MVMVMVMKTWRWLTWRDHNLRNERFLELWRARRSPGGKFSSSKGFPPGQLSAKYPLLYIWTSSYYSSIIIIIFASLTRAMCILCENLVVKKLPKVHSGLLHLLSFPTLLSSYCTFPLPPSLSQVFQGHTSSCFEPTEACLGVCNSAI